MLTLYAQRRENPLPLIVDPLLQGILGAARARALITTTSSSTGPDSPILNIQQALRDFLKHKYAGRRFDIVIAASSQALGFVKANRDELFAGVPVVFHIPELEPSRVRLGCPSRVRPE